MDDSCCMSFENIVSLNNNTKTSIDDLPNDFVINIFSRLPVKTLLLSTCVNKKWFSIIKTPTFISAHLSRSLSGTVIPTPTYIIIIHTIVSQLNVFSDNGRRLIRHPDLKLPFKTRSRSTKLVGACNGLICVTDHSNKYEGRDLYLLNPFINKFRKLSVDCSTHVELIGDISNTKTVDIFVGFGYSEIEDDHKVVRIIIRHSDANRRGLYSPKIEIYSVKSRTWKHVDVSIKIKKPVTTEIAVFAQGCLYWHVEDYEKDDDYLLCFNLKDEAFIKIKLPANYHKLKGTWDRCIISKKDSVAVVLHTDGPNDSMKISLFVLEKKFEEGGWVYNWKEIKYRCAEFSIKKCWGFSRDHGRMIMSWGFPDKYLVAIDDSGAMEKVGLYRSIDNYCYGAMNVFETLALFSD